MHDENAGNLCHKLQTNTIGPFTNLGEHQESNVKCQAKALALNQVTSKS